MKYTIPDYLFRRGCALPCHITLEPLFLPRGKPHPTPHSLGLQPLSVLQLFHRSDRSSRKVKLENIRYRLLRGLKKTLRGVMSEGHKKVAKKLLPENCSDSHPEYRRLKDWCAKLSREADAFAKLGNGPKVDSQRAPHHCTFTTYNNSYLRTVFQSPAIRLLYRLFINLIMSERKPESLAKRLAITCCRPPNSHTELCYQKWSSLHVVLSRYLGAEVPNPEETIESLESLVERLEPK